MSIIKAFLRHPVRTGAIAASSPRLATAITGGLGVESAGNVVELGPGTGVFTEVLLRMVTPDASFTALEINSRLVRDLRARFPTLHLAEDSAEHIASYAMAPIDVVVSGLPWTAMPAPRQGKILNEVCEALSLQGCLTTFAYAHAAWTPPARRFARLLRSRFAVVERTRVVWQNMPPAYVYRAALPVLRGADRHGKPIATAA
ncbi:class I SAM-dependent methyltransferase [Amycolatopsis panacis]|uniref:Methyltransferase domain-containing protein n=1 Tax=Amycolatopsis panacis TaxID=2340917 RepID=A0A419I8F8_9PSEU|nr:methyltransferase domain-containing protein [Amycolatopsis panacis]RJQ88443.1 methyltransferase domain-containing protein [Amycolatopsis panacis]